MSGSAEASSSFENNQNSGNSSDQPGKDDTKQNEESLSILKPFGSNSSPVKEGRYFTFNPSDLDTSDDDNDNTTNIWDRLNAPKKKQPVGRFELPPEEEELRREANDPANDGQPAPFGLQRRFELITELTSTHRTVPFGSNPFRSEGAAQHSEPFGSGLSRFQYAREQNSLKNTRTFYATKHDANCCAGGGRYRRPMVDTNVNLERLRDSEYLAAHNNIFYGYPFGRNSQCF